MKRGRNPKQETGFLSPRIGLSTGEMSSGRLDASHIGAQFVTLGKTLDCLDRFGHRGLFGIKDAAGAGRAQLTAANDCDDCLNPGITVSPDPEADDVLGAGDFTGASHEFAVLDRAHWEAPLGVPEAYNAGCEDRSADLTEVALAAPEPFSIQTEASPLTSHSCVDLAQACGRTVRLWEARALALHHLAAGHMDAALRVMGHANGGAR